VAAPPLTDGERRLGLVLGVVAVAAFVALSGGRVLFLAVGLTMAVGLLVTTGRRSRVGAAFFAFVTTFGPWSFAAVFGLPYAVFALWLLARAGRVGSVTSPAPSEGSAAARRDDGPAT